MLTLQILSSLFLMVLLAGGGLCCFIVLLAAETSIERWLATATGTTALFVLSVSMIDIWSI